MKKKRYIVLYVLAAFVLLIILGNANQPTHFKGVSLSPIAYDEEGFLDFLDKTEETGNMVTWAGDWIGLSTGEGPVILTELSKRHKFTPLVAVGHHIQSTGELIRPLSEENRKLYKNSTKEFVKKYKPKFFVMGVEINVLADKAPADFDEFVDFYNEVYEIIKETSPKTQVFTVHQLERMKGHPQYWVEGEPSEDKAQWNMLSDFRSDIAGFTTYPALIYKDPSDIPANYYTELLDRTDKPIAFIEIGWHADNYPPGWESSGGEQATFVDRYFELTAAVDPVINIWPFMYDPEITRPLNTMGLIDSEGIKRPSWDRWILER